MSIGTYKKSISSYKLRARKTPDAMIKMAIMNYFLTLISATNVEEAIDVEILFQSVADEVNLLTRELIARVSKVKHQIESNT